MAQFVIEILDGDRAGEVVTLPTRPLRIGRKPGNDLVIVDEKTSGSHAEVAPDGERFVLRDLGSTNGTFLDGKRVTEVGLTPGDVFVVGRVKMCFRPEGASVAGAAGNGEGFEVHRIDQAMLQRARRSRSAALLWVLLLCGIGCAAWLLFVRTAGGGGGPVGPSKKNPLVVAGNLLPADVAGCEGEDGWVLGGGGAGFAVAGGANTGHGAFEALRSAGAGAAAYALARSKEPRLVLGGKTLTVAAYLHTENGAQAAVRLHFFSSQDGNLFH
ncbi:MAG TPA: FHA domain-containing protein, partial [Planctomycetota bacterium]|nr:FHA domain-containing protein [Planctomycetota bacterium]